MHRTCSMFATVNVVSGAEKDVHTTRVIAQGLW